MPTLTIEEARTELAGLEGFGRTVLHRTEQPNFEVRDGALMLDVGPEGNRNAFRLTRDAFAALAKDSGAGDRFLAALPPRLSIDVLNHTYAEREDRQPIHLLTRERNERQYIVDLVKPRRAPVSPARVLSVVHDVVGNQVQVPFMHRKGVHSVTLAATTPERQYEMSNVRQVGDILNGGVLLDFSPSGANALNVSSYVSRLFCTNGMVSQDTLDRWTAPVHGGDGTQDVYEWLADAVQRAYDSSEQMFNESQRMADQTVTEEQLPMLVEDLFTTYRLSGRVQEAVTRRLAEQNVQNLWDVANAVTFVATHDDRITDPRQRVRLMTTGGDLARHNDRCEACHRVLMHNN